MPGIFSLKFKRDIQVNRTLFQFMARLVISFATDQVGILLRNVHTGYPVFTVLANHRWIYSHILPPVICYTYTLSYINLHPITYPDLLLWHLDYP